MQIEVRNGAFHYPNGKSVLQSVNFSFDGRGVFAVLGPNGAGKTTLLKCLLGLLPWSSGASFFNGRDRREWSTREFWRRTAYVPQARASAFAPLTLRELVVLGRSARIGAFSQPSRTDWTACDHAMELLSVSVCWLSASLPRSLEDSSSLPTSHVLWLQNLNSSYWTNLKAALTSKIKPQCSMSLIS